MKSKFSILISTAFALGAALFLSPLPSAQSTPQKIEIVAKRFDFTPSEVTLKKGVPVILVLTSKDVDHGLKVQELNILLKVKKGETKQFDFTPGQVGTFNAQCAVFCGMGHGSMKMIFHVME